MLKKIFEFATSAVALIIMAVIIIALGWGMQDNYISYFWIIVLVGVLIGELVNKLWSPDKRTVSSNIRTEVKKGGWRIWAMLAAWLVFSIQLFLHFIKPLIIGG